MPCLYEAQHVSGDTPPKTALAASGFSYSYVERCLEV